MGKKQWQRVCFSFALALVVLGLMLPNAWAAAPGGDPRDKFLAGSTVTIPADETVPHDLYVTGGTIRIDGRIDGDLFVAGGNVTVNGPVGGDLFVAGGTVNIASSVDRHLRAVGGDVTVSGPVTLDLLALAGMLTLSSSAHVGGDFIFRAGDTFLDGTVDGSVLGTAGTYTNGGSVGGTEEVTLQQSRARKAQPPSAASRLLDELRRYLSIILVGVLLTVLAPRILQTAASRVRERPLPSVGVGILTFAAFFGGLLALFIAMFVSAIVLGVLGFGQLALAVVFGVLLGSGIASYILVFISLFVAAVVVGLTLGRLILGQIAAPWAEGPYPELLLGVLIVVILTALPVVGGLLSAIVVLFGLGALVLSLWQLRPPPAQHNLYAPVGTP